MAHFTDLSQNDKEHDAISLPADSGREIRSKTCVLLTGAIAPYTNRFYDGFAKASGVDFSVLTCDKIEPQRSWDMPVPTHYKLKVLPGFRHHASYTSHIYFNPTIWYELYQRRPDWVVISGFSPTMMMAALYAFVTGTPLGVATDGSVETDPGQLSRIHRFMRYLVVPRASFGVCASDDSVQLLESYGLPEGRGAVVPIVTAWETPLSTPGFNERDYDILFCGALDEDRKGVLFFCDVLTTLKESRRDLKVRIVGDGPLRSEVTDRLLNAGISTRFDGYLQADEVKEAYATARLLLFPSRGDPWGLVANEAIANGTPVIGSPHAVSTPELVERYGVGRNLALDVDRWAEASAQILGSQDMWQGYRENMPKACKAFALGTAVEALGVALRLGASPLEVSKREDGPGSDDDA